MDAGGFDKVWTLCGGRSAGEEVLEPYEDYEECPLTVEGILQRESKKASIPDWRKDMHLKPRNGTRVATAHAWSCP